MARLEVRDNVTYCIEDDGAEWVYEVLPMLPPSLDEVKVQKLAELEQARDEHIFSSFTSTALDGVTPKTYNSDKEAFENMRDKTLAVLADPTVATVTWYNQEDGFVSHTREQFLQLEKENAARIEGLKMEYFHLEGLVELAYLTGDADSIQAIVW